MRSTEIPGRTARRRPQAALRELIDAVSNKDDEIADLVIEDKPVEPLVLKAAIRRLTCKNEFVPVLCGSAFKKKGVQALVDAVVDYLPSPLDIPPAEGTEPGTDNVVTVEAGRQREILLAGLQTVDGCLCRETGVFPRLFAASSRRATSFTTRARAGATGSAA